MPICNVREVLDAEDFERIESEASCDDELFYELIELADILDEMEV